MSDIDRLLALFDQAPDSVRDSGRNWYPAAWSEASAIAREHGVTPRVAAGVIAALSPRVKWPINLRVARDLIADPSDARVPVFGRNADKARAILSGARPLSVLRGPKTRAFYRNISGDVEPVTIDVWASRALGRPAPTTARAYADAERVYQDAADTCGETPRDLQAICWIMTRDGAQLSLDD